MSAISLKSITGITSITTPAGVDNVFTVHTNDTTERFRVDQTGNLNIAGIITATSFSGSGASLTNLNASNISSGTVPTARLGSGTASSSTFLAGDSTFKTITGVTINSNADNRLITGSGTANTLNGESSFTYNAGTLIQSNSNGNVVTQLNATSGDAKIVLDNSGNGNYSSIDFERERSTGAGVNGGSIFMLSDTSSNDAYLYLQAQSASAQAPVTSALADDNGVRLILKGGDGIFSVETGSAERLRIDSTGRLLLGSGATATPKITGPGGLDVSQYGLSICMGGSSGSSGQARANATTKEARLVIPHYTNAEEPLTAIAAFSTSSYNYINYGGGTSLGNVATRHQFYTAANTTTTGGSEKLKIEHSGVRSFATFVDTSYHANPDPLGDGSGIAYYRLNNNFQDSGRFGNHGQGIQGGDPTFALVNSSGEPCWNNPTDGAINLPNLKNSYPFSMAAWINVSSWPTSADNDVIMNLSIGGQRVTLSICCFSSAASDGADFYIMYGGTGHHYIRPSSKPTNSWIHVLYSVVSSNNTSHRVYQNGTDLTTRGNRGGSHGGSAGWAMGGNAANSERFAIGRIGSIRFFNKALSSSEASALYTNDTFYT